MHSLKFSKHIFFIFSYISITYSIYAQQINYITYSDTVLNVRLDSVVNLLTLEEKIQMIKSSGAFTNGNVPRLGIPSLKMSDGPHGVKYDIAWNWDVDNNNLQKATYLPCELLLAATWNRKLAFEYGKVLGSETHARGKNIILAPGINIIRTPLNGRNFEYLSEDPFLVSELCVPHIRGVQSMGIAACVKHYLANNQETNRQKVDVQMSERALREIYLVGFKNAIEKGESFAIMGAYNKFRGQYCSHNKYLNKILKDELKFKGILISDWSAVQNTEEAIKYGTDIEMGTEMRNWGKWDFILHF
ncbi:MAG: glycoside hydrolase family 3 N-terminal domain-containing protein [Cytophagales bacterium]